MKLCSECLLLTLVYITLPPAVSEASPVTGYLGGDVILPCHMNEPNININQVQWDLMSPGGNYSRILVFNPQFGVNISDSPLRDRVEINEHSLTIKNVKMTDAGTYTCRAAVYPDGSRERTINLIVQEETPSSLAVIYATIAVALLLGILAALAYLTFRCVPVRRHDNSDTIQYTVTDASRREDLVYSEIKLKKSRGSTTPSSHQDMTTESADGTYSEVVF